MFPKMGDFTTKMDGENNGSEPYEQMDDLVGFPIIFGLYFEAPTLQKKAEIPIKTGGPIWVPGMVTYFLVGDPYTLPKTNIAPARRPSQKETNLPI